MGHDKNISAVSRFMHVLGGTVAMRENVGRSAHNPLLILSSVPHPGLREVTLQINFTVVLISIRRILNNHSNK